MKSRRLLYALSAVLVCLATFVPYAAAQVAPEFMKGVNYTPWQRGELSSSASDVTLKIVIQPMGVNWLSIVVTCQQTMADATDIDCARTATATDADLVHGIQSAHALGMKVMLKPHIDLSSDPAHWRGDIGTMFDEDTWRTWFESYTEIITHYANLSRENGVEALVIGTELKGTSHRSDEWRLIVSEVRALFPGQLLYAANWDEYASIDWWDALDYIGIDAYFQLSTKNDPTVAELKAAWIPLVNELEQQSETWSKGIVLTEIGYQSKDGTSMAPYNFGAQGNVDLEEQSDCYEAAIESLKGKEWWEGVFWWNWTVEPNQGGPADTDFTANGKPAQAVLQAFFGGSGGNGPAPSRSYLFKSPDGRLSVSATGSGTDIHYIVVEIKTGNVIIRTHGQYNNPNNVKAGEFSPDSRLFAAYYHYAGPYTWVGIWSVETGALLYEQTVSGWITRLPGIFDRATG